MLAKFACGYFLEVIISQDGTEYLYYVYDEDRDMIDSGWTEYRDIELYYPKNLIDYILEFCEPDDVSGTYELVETM